MLFLNLLLGLPSHLFPSLFSIKFLPHISNLSFDLHEIPHTFGVYLIIFTSI
jgi:hypothetical protein